MIKYVLIEGNKYPINTDFRVAIKCDEILNDPNVDDLDRGILITGLLFGSESPYCNEALEKAKKFLENGASGEGKKILDFNQHWDYYYGAFRAQYGIDLNKDDIHYHDFVSLCKTLKNQAINDVIEILTYDMSEIKDPKQRRKIIDAQKKLKVKEVSNVNNSFIDILDPKVKGG